MEEKEKENIEPIKTKKNLLIVTDTFLPRMDGVTRFLVDLIPLLREEYKITVMTTNFGPINLSYYDLKDVKLVRFKSAKFSYANIKPAIPDFKKIKEEIKSNDIVFIQTGALLGFLAARYSKKYNIPAIAYIHTVDWDWFSKTSKYLKLTILRLSTIYSRFLYNSVDMIIVPFLELKEKFKKKKITNANITVAYLGVDLKRFVPPENKLDAKEAIGISRGKFVIGYVGRLSREKNIDTLIDAFLDLEKTEKNVTLLIVGSGLKMYENRTQESKNIMWVGKKDDVVPYIQAMDAFVLPSLTETTSLATIEAMSAGVVPVCTPVGYVKEYIKEKENGMLFPFENSLVLKLKLKQLIDDVDLHKRLCENARNTALSRFSWDKTVNRIKFILSQF